MLGVTPCSIDQIYVYIFWYNFISFKKDRMSSILTFSNRSCNDNWEDPERPKHGAKVLGLKVCGEHDTLRWKQGTAILEPPAEMTRCTVFSMYGKLVGYFLICGWLCVIAGVLKDMWLWWPKDGMTRLLMPPSGELCQKYWWGWPVMNLSKVTGVYPGKSWVSGLMRACWQLAWCCRGSMLASSDKWHPTYKFSKAWWHSERSQPRVTMAS